MSKSRLYDGDDSATWTLHRVVRDLLSTMSPICPFFCHYLSTTLYGSSAVDVRSFPRLPELMTPEDATYMRSLTPIISEFNSEVCSLNCVNLWFECTASNEHSIDCGFGPLSFKEANQ